MISSWGATGGLKPAMSLNLLSGAISSLVSFTRATPATVTDFEGLIKTVKSGEVRFDGMRRVENLLSTSETLSTQSVTVIAGTYAFTLGATSTGSVTFSGASTGTLAGNGANRKYITLTTTAGSLTITVTGSVLQAQLESVQGQTNQNPSEYIATSVLSYPYQGAGVDGVQYFPYTNPNCIINGAITQIPTVSINSSNSKFTYGTTASGDYFSTPSSAVNQITGDLSLLVQVALDDWTPATVQTLVAKDGVSAGTRSWAFNIQTSGALRINYSLDGTNIISVTASASTGFTDGTVHYVGVQREASTGIVRFYTSEDGSTFTLLGTQQTGTSGSLYNASSTAVQFGNLSGLSFALDGKIYDSHVYNGLKFSGTSTMVMDFDPSNWTSGTTFTGLETGEVWTLNGNAKIYQGLWDAQGPKCLLIEEQRTNLVTYSDQLDNGVWGKYTANSIIPNYGIAPDGTQTADQFSLVTGASAAQGFFYNSITATAQTYTHSIYVKPLDSQMFFALVGLDGFSTSYNLSTLAVTAGEGGTSTGTITVVGNEWYRLTRTVTATAGTQYPVLFAIPSYPRIGGPTAWTPTSPSRTLFWGAQLEVGSFATSYIPTVASAVTRNADQASMTGTNFSSWYNTSQDSLYWEGDVIDISSQTKALYALSDNTITNRIDAYEASGTINFDLYGTSKSSVTANTIFKVAQSLNSTTVLTALNGSASSTANTMALGLNRLNLGSNYTLGTNTMSGHIRRFNVYPVALPSATLQALTS